MAVGSLFGALGKILAALGMILGRPGDLLDSLGGILGAQESLLVRSWGAQESFLGRSWASPGVGALTGRPPERPRGGPGLTGRPRGVRPPIGRSGLGIYSFPECPGPRYAGICIYVYIYIYIYI